METGFDMNVSESKEKAYVAFQGGGALGVAHFGAWQAISEHFEIVGVAGTSSGSIIAALCAAGFSAEEAFERFQAGLHKFVEHKNPTCSEMFLSVMIPVRLFPEKGCVVAFRSLPLALCLRTSGSTFGVSSGVDWRIANWLRQPCRYRRYGNPIAQVSPACCCSEALGLVPGN